MAEYQTPDTGTTYTLFSLAYKAPHVLEQTEDGYLLKDRLILSGSDILVASDANLFIEPIDPELFTGPLFLIEGRLIAENLVVTTNGDDVKDPNLAHAFLVSASDENDLSEASFTNCIFHTLGFAVDVRHKAKIKMENSTIENCYFHGFFAYMQSDATIINSTFNDADVIFLDSEGSLEQSHFQNAHLSLEEINHDFPVRNCLFEGEKDVGVFIKDSSGVKFEKNIIKGYHHGIIVSGNSDPVLSRNTIKDSLEGGLVAEDNAAPVLRENRIIKNALNPPSVNGPVLLPAILIQDSARPDLGTSVTLGKNVIFDNSGLNVYNATKHRIFAQGNYWDDYLLQKIEDTIYHEPDDYDDADQSGFFSGFVEYYPFWWEPVKVSCFVLF